MEEIQNILQEISSWLSHPLFKIGNTDVSSWTIIYVIAVIIVLFYVTGKLNRIFVHRVLAKSKIDLGKRVAMGSLIRYVVLTIGIIIVLQTAGINLSSLTVLLGALGVGIGFGLQTITNNLISGLIIFLERPIKVGDRIEVDGIEGNVTSISMRATEILTNANISIIVPNSEFISKTVINWSHSDRDVRFDFPVGVSYDADVDKVHDALMQVAREEPGVLDEPAPAVLIKEFSESSITFMMRVWSREFTDRPGRLRSRIYFGIARKFNELGIRFPYPQRDIHIKGMPPGASMQE